MKGGFDMADINKLNLNDTDYNIKDATAREKLTVIDPTAGEGLITFGVDANGNYGYKKVGADTVTPFLTGGSSDITALLGTKKFQLSQSFSQTIYSNYQQVPYSTPLFIPLPSGLTMPKGSFVVICANGYSFNIGAYDTDGNYLQNVDYTNLPFDNTGSNKSKMSVFKATKDLTLDRIRISCDTNGGTGRIYGQSYGGSNPTYTYIGYCIIK